MRRLALRKPRKPRFYRFSELTRENTNRDFQIHTDWTDGEAPVAAVLRRAQDVGLAELAFTEHARATSDYYPAFFREIDGLSAASEGMTVYRGFEVKVLSPDGRLDISEPMREAADIVLASVHSFPLDDGSVAPAAKFTREEAVEIEFGLARGVIENGAADVLSHAGGMCLRTFGAFPMAYMDDLVGLAAGRDVAFEINAAYHGAILKPLLDTLARHDPLVSIGSDAHRLDDVGSCRDLLREALSL